MSTTLFGVLAGVLVAGVAYVLLRLAAGPDRPVPGADVAYTSLVGRIEELEDKYNRLDRRFTRIQGEFNALTRMEAEDEPLPEEG